MTYEKLAKRALEEARRNILSLKNPAPYKRLVAEIDKALAALGALK